MEKDPWKLVNRSIGYENPWIRVDHDEVLNPAENPGIYGVVRFKNVAIGIVPVDEKGYTTLVGQWRYPLNQYSWEIPEGGGPHNEELLLSAQRELQEETGLRATRWIKTLDLHMSNSITDEIGVTYLALDLTEGEASPEETEVFQHKKIPLTEAVDLIYQGEITDALSIIGLLAAERYLRQHHSELLR